MKKHLIIALLSCLFLLASCKSLVSIPPVTQKVPDVINKPTNTIITKDVIAEIPKNTQLKTDTIAKTTAVLVEDTLVTINEFKEKSSQLLIPKNTLVVLPENTQLQTTDISKVQIDAKTEVILPIGTEISITKINWYAILFYSVVVIWISYYYLRSSRQDADGDGFVDDKKPKSKRKSTL